LRAVSVAGPENACIFDLRQPARESLRYCLGMPAQTVIIALSCPSCGARDQARAILPQEGGPISIVALPRQFRLMRIDYTLEDTRFGCPECKIPVKAVIDARETTEVPCQ
jgi:hypothetical protein